MKALEKDRSRRYCTANGLASDIQHFLAHEPVSARPPSKLYRIQKAAQRNRVAFAATGAIAFLIIVSLVVVSASLAKERRARRDAEAASRKSEQVKKFLEQMLKGVGPSVALGADTKLLRRILDDTVERLDKEMSGQPEVEAELWNTIGDVYGEIRHPDQGEKMVRRALEINQKVFGSQSLETAASWHLLGQQLMGQYKRPESERAHIEALAIRRRLLGEEHLDTAVSLSSLAAVYGEEGKLEDAETMAREALRIGLKVGGTNSAQIPQLLRNLCMVLGYAEKWPEAEETARRLLHLSRYRDGREHPSVAGALHDLAWTVNAQNKTAEAEALEAENAMMHEKLFGGSQVDVTLSLNSLGKLLGKQGDQQASEAVLQAVLSVQKKMLAEDHPATLETMVSLAKALQAQGKREEAEAVLRDALVRWDKRQENENPSRLYVLRGLGENLESQGKWPEAQKIWKDSLALWRKRGGVEERQSMYTLRKLGLALEAGRNLPEAESVYRDALAVSRKKGDNDSEAMSDLEKLVRVLMLEKKFTEARELLDRGLTPAVVGTSPGMGLLILRVNVMGRQGRWQDAATNAALAMQNQPTDHYRCHTLAAILAMVGDRSAYQEVCKDIVSKFADSTDPYVAERIAQDNLLLPDSGADLALMDKLADKAVATGGGTDGFPYFQACKAMSQYRLGHFSDATNWADKASKSSAPFAQAKAFAVLAMTHWQLGHPDEAHTALTQGDALAPRLSTAADGVDLGESWVAWLMARISLDEASKLIGTPDINSQP
jgi:tetratricopeptide (TPR) repeat protein